MKKIAPLIMLLCFLFLTGLTQEPGTVKVLGEVATPPTLL
jgi:hypothetical protein